MEPTEKTASKSDRAIKRANGEGSIYVIGRRSDGRPNKWRAAIYDINGKRRPKVFRSRKEAEEWLHQQKSARQHGEITYAINPKMTVGEFLTIWVENIKPTVKYNTYKSYRASIKTRINPYIGKLNAAKLSPLAVDGLMAQLQNAGYKAGSINGAFRALRAAYNYAVLKQILPTNPIARATDPKLVSISPRPLPKDDWEKIYFEASKDPYLHARIEIGGVCGNRTGEVRGFKWSDLDIENQILWVERQVVEAPGKGLYFDTPKTNETRKLFLSKKQIEILLRHKRYQALNKANWKEDLDLIFPNSVGKMMDSKADARMFKSLCARAGVPQYQLTRMRKTAFTNMAGATDPKTALDYSGHTQISTLMKHYVFSTPESIKKLLDELDEQKPKVFEYSVLEDHMHLHQP